jgi:4-hydroxybenzoate polyprenyltransferase
MIKDFFKLCRLSQWYKNLVIFLPIIFAQQLLNFDFLSKVAIGFFSLALISSASYIINDIADIDRDRFHAEKKNRPLASGKVRVWQALLLATILLVLSLFIAYSLSMMFFYLVIILFVITQIYTFFLKNEAFADILVLGINFVIRASSGAFVIAVGSSPYVQVSPWLILCTFCLSLFMSAGKREADLQYLGSNAKSHKETLAVYTKSMTGKLILIATILLVISYSLYAFLGIHQRLIFTLPFAFYVIFRYFLLIESGSEIARQPEKVYKDARIVVGISLWVILTLFILY